MRRSSIHCVEYTVCSTHPRLAYNFASLILNALFRRLFSPFEWNRIIFCFIRSNEQFRSLDQCGSFHGLTKYLVNEAKTKLERDLYMAIMFVLSFQRFIP